MDQTQEHAVESVTAGQSSTRIIEKRPPRGWYLGAAIVAVCVTLVSALWSPGRSERSEVGGPAWPDQAARSTTLALLVWSTLAMLSAFFPVEAVWHYGPFETLSSYPPLDPDWYLFWIEAAYRLIPGALDFHLLGADFTNPFYGTAVLSAFVFGGCALYPLLDQRIYNALDRDHHALESSWERPFRTAFGVSGITFLLFLSLGAANDRIADALRMSIEDLNVLWRALTVGAPPAMFVCSYFSLRIVRSRHVKTARSRWASAAELALIGATALWTLIRMYARRWLDGVRLGGGRR